jgi:hypothetical protein
MDLDCDPQILTKFLVENLDCRSRSCMEEGSSHEAVPWAGHHCASGPLKLVVESWATSSSVKTY